MARARKLTAFEEQLLAELRSLRLAIMDHSKNTGKWLSAVATAAANPADNTAEVQKALDQIAADINASSDEVEEALNQQTKENENGS